MDLLRNKLFLFALVTSLALGMAAFVACGDDDDDDDDDTATDDDDVADDAADDVADDVADDAADDCTTGMTYVYDCGFVLADVEGNELSLADAIAACQASDAFAACAAGCGLVSADCTELETCVNDNCAA